MKYLVAWEVLETGHVEKGRLYYSSSIEAEEIARMLNDAWPEFRHWVEPLDPAAQVPQAARAARAAHAALAAAAGKSQEDAA